MVIRKVIAEDEDPALLGFLDLLENHMTRHKDRTTFATEGFANYLQELTDGIEVEYDAPTKGTSSSRDLPAPMWTCPTNLAGTSTATVERWGSIESTGSAQSSATDATACSSATA